MRHRSVRGMRSVWHEPLEHTGQTSRVNGFEQILERLFFQLLQRLLFEAGAGAFVLSFPETANFSVGADEVVAQPARAAEPRAVEIGFLGVVMSFWLELQRIPTLHASAPNARKPVAPLPHLAQGAAGLAGLAILMAPLSVQRRNQLTQPCRVREVALLTGSQIAHVVAQKSLIFLNLPRFAPDTDEKRGATWCHFSHLQTEARFTIDRD